jgi:predicted alpha/beta superfamily hydrolase
VGGAPNHRYTAVPAVFDAMRAQGWIAEGDGVTGVFACGPAPPNGGSTVTFLSSLRLGTTYEITIDVPPGYHPNIDPLPVIYALDAQYRLGTLRGVMNQLNARAILVAIADMDQRQRDFNMPGAIDYLAFLTRDVIPYVEANYRADPRKRVLSGHSTGGNFPFHALYLETPGKWSFAHYWSTEGAFFQQMQAIDTEEQAIFDAMGSTLFPETLILARASDALGGPSGSDNADVVKALYDKLAARRYNGLRLLAPYYPEADHATADAPAFAYGLSVLFGGSAQ